jgi:hypothetical protein
MYFSMKNYLKSNHNMLNQFGTTQHDCQFLKFKGIYLSQWRLRT